MKYHRLQSFSIRSYGDSITLYLFGSLSQNLSNIYPWWTIFEYSIRLVSPLYFGIMINTFNLYCGVFVALSMMLLLKEIKMNKITTIMGSLLYLGNPIVLHHIGILDWTFFSSFPLILFSIIKYNKTGYFYYLVVLLFSLEIPIQMDWINNGIATFRFLIPAIGIFLLSPLMTRSKKILFVLRDYFIVLFLFIFLNIYIIYITLFGFNSYSYVQSVGTNTVSNFYRYHMANVLFTYSGQNIIFSLTGLMVYNGSVLYNLGYSTTYLIGTAIWFFIVLFSLIFSILKKSELSIYMRMASISFVLIVLFQVGIYYHLLLFLFLKFPFLFVYENPSFLNRPQAFIEILLIAYSFNYFSQRLKDDRFAIVIYFNSRIKIAFNFIKTKNIYTIFVILIASFILIAPSVPIYQNFVINDQELPNSQHYLPQYYNSIGSFFQGKLNFSRVIFLPLNFTTYGRALTVVPSNHLFYVAAGSVNNNGNGPTNISVLQDVFQSIIYGNASNIASTMEISNIKYVVITNSTQNISISCLGNYLNGNTSDFLSKFIDSNYFKNVYSNANFNILENKLYKNPLFIPRIFTLNKYISNNYSNYSLEIVKNSSFNGSYKDLTEIWHPWSDEIGGQNIIFNNSAVKLLVNGSENTTGNLPPVSQIWQDVAVFPGETLIFSITFKNINNSIPFPFLTLDNMVNKGNLYPPTQYYYNGKAFLKNFRNGTFSINFTVPNNIYYINLGILIHNKTSGNGSVTISNMKLLNTFNSTIYGISNNQLTTNYFLINSSKYNDVIPTHAYFFQIPQSIIFPSNGSISLVPNVGAYLTNTTVKFILPASLKNVTKLIFDVGVINGISSNFNILFGNENISSSSNELVTFENLSSKGKNYNLQFNISVDGTIFLSSIFALTGLNNLVNLTINRSTSGFLMSSEKNGTFALGSSELPSIQINSNMNITKINGFYIIVGKINRTSNISISFPYLGTVNYIIVYYNIGFLAMISTLTFYLYRSRKKHKIK